MDYGDDPCMDNFTPNQLTRLRSLYDEFRASYKGPLPSSRKAEELAAARRSLDRKREARLLVARD